jgi:bifunctional NMN adenylyltransferase/nudix hydrolase
MSKKKLAFIVGRFQNVELHAGYFHLLERASLLPDVTDIVIIMGSSPVPATRHNPFTFEERKQMFIDSVLSYKDYMLSHIAGFIEQMDQNEDAVWSKNLDRAIDKFICNDNRFYHTHDPILVCSRDSFKPYYSGDVEVVEVEPDEYSTTSTEDRDNVARQKGFVNKAYLVGKLKGIYAKYPTVYATVDIAIINETFNEILLGRKHRETKWRFPGGFSDPTDMSFEDAAKREAREEVGNIELADWQHVGSMRVDDWRYRKGVDKIITNFYRCSYIFGKPVASDDLAEIKWFKLDEIKHEDMFPGHIELLKKLKSFEYQRKKIQTALQFIADV